ncbi:Cof-type HAD-IIB family hydrolase [Pseudalkalibacillus sp. SCS-8]|uniref:Cof-type HAD-IIB family hydrolase n=1 Tax=Pseudalkalibacillus nanhaiensis TaxID=3115291 RepID=UPI0032DB6182
MKNKIVFFDIDGTLLDHQKEIPVGTRSAIQELSERQVPMIIATGRAPFMFKALRESLGIDGYVSFNGQYVSYEDSCVYENPLDESILQKLVTHSNEFDHPMVFLNTEEGKATHDQHPHIQKSMNDLKMHHPAHEPDFFRGRSIFQALLYCEKATEESFYKDAYKDFNFIRWHQYSIDVLPRTGSKAVGIEKMIQHLGYHQEDVIAFGDGLNDLEMLEYAGTGIAMGNGKEAAKRSADFVTKAVDDDGIRHGLKKLGLIR